MKWHGLTDEEIKMLIPEKYKEFMEEDDLVALAWLKKIKNIGNGELHLSVRDRIIINIEPTPKYYRKRDSGQ
jgi:hypothetical protein